MWDASAEVEWLTFNRTVKCSSPFTAGKAVIRVMLGGIAASGTGTIETELRHRGTKLMLDIRFLIEKYTGHQREISRYVVDV